MRVPIRERERERKLNAPGREHIREGVRERRLAWIVVRLYVCYVCRARVCVMRRR